MRNVCLLLVCGLRILSLSELSHAYPVFFKCDAKENVVEFVPDAQFENYLESIFDFNSETVFSLCQGLADCVKQFEQILQLAQVDQAAARKILKEHIAKLNVNSDGPVRVSNDDFKFHKSVNDLSRSVNACHKKKAQAPQELFTKMGPLGESVLVYYPYYSNYMYITGCSKLGEKSQCYFNTVSSISNGVEDALLMGADPYVALAIGFMEGGANGISNLYLDPIGKMSAMGCSGKHVKDGSKDEEVLESFGNLHKIEDHVLQNKGLVERFKKFLTVKKQEFEIKKSYLCRSVTDSDGTFSDTPKSGECCLELDFAPKKQEGANVLTRALTMENIRKYIKQPFRGKTDPAFRVQRFNGYSKLMGGAEFVPAFRNGINFYEEPTYGYQAMDYVINSLMTNPYIRQLVDSKKLELGSEYKSILCMAKKEGFYSLDTDTYFKKHQTAKRLSSIKDRVDRGLKWAQLTDREQKVMTTEFFSPRVSESLTSIPNTQTQFGMVLPKESKEMNSLSQKFWQESGEFFKKYTAEKGNQLNIMHQTFLTNMTEGEFVDSIIIPPKYSDRENAIELLRLIYRETMELNTKMQKTYEPWNEYGQEFQNVIGKYLTTGKIRMKGFGDQLMSPYMWQDITMEKPGEDSNTNAVSFGPKTVDEFVAQYDVSEDLEDRDEIIAGLKTLGTKYLSLMEQQKQQQLNAGGFGPGKKNNNLTMKQFMSKHKEIAVSNGVSGFVTVHRPAHDDEVLEKLQLDRHLDKELVSKALALAKTNRRLLGLQKTMHKNQLIVKQNHKPASKELNERDREAKRTIDFDAALKEYFSKVYESRDTVSEASDFRWHALTDKDVVKLRLKIGEHLNLKGGMGVGGFGYPVGFGF